jgi:dUTP pyrophosphatase
MSVIDKMRERIMDIINPDVEYTQEDFEKEFVDSNQIDTSFKLDIKFINKSNNPNPEYATNGSAGFDLRANLEEEITILAKGGRAIVPTGLYFELPSNFEMQIRPRSGLAAKNGVTVLNSPGTIDSDYRGEVKVILINHGEEDFKINHGDRIAQCVIASVINNNIFNLNQVNEISDDTQRSSGGFGSTGIK